MYDALTQFFGVSWAGRALFVTVFLLGHTFLMRYFLSVLCALDTPLKLSFFEKVKDDKFLGNVIFVCVCFWFFAYYSSTLVHTEFGIDLDTSVERQGFLQSLFNLLATIVLGLLDVVVFLISIPLSFVMVFIVIPAVVFYLLSTVPYLVYGLIASTHYLFAKHPAQEYLERSNPDVAGFIHETEKRKRQKQYAFVSENYRRKSESLLNKVRVQREREEGAPAREQAKQNAALERQRIKDEIARLKTQEQALTKEYGTKTQRERQQALNDQDADLIKRYTEKMKNERR